MWRLITFLSRYKRVLIDVMAAPHGVLFQFKLSRHYLNLLHIVIVIGKKWCWVVNFFKKEKYLVRQIIKQFYWCFAPVNNSVYQSQSMTCISYWYINKTCYTRSLSPCKYIEKRSRKFSFSDMTLQEHKSTNVHSIGIWRKKWYEYAFNPSTQYFPRSHKISAKYIGLIYLVCLRT